MLIGDSLARSPGTSTPARLRSAPPDLPRRKEPSAGGVLGARRNLRVSTRPRRCTTRHRFLGTELPSALLMRPINKNGGRLRLAEFSRTQHSRIPGYCQILQNLRNSGVTAARSTIIPNQGPTKTEPFLLAVLYRSLLVVSFQNIPSYSLHVNRVKCKAIRIIP